MIEKIREIFDGELQIEDIRKIATYEYELDTKGYYYYYGGYKLPMSTFKIMFENGFTNIRIMNSSDARSIGLWDLEYVITIRFTIDIEKFNEKQEEREEWRRRWNEITSSREN